MIQLSVDLARKLNIYCDTEVSLGIGAKKEKVRFEIDTTSGNKYLILPETITEVFLSRSCQPLGVFSNDKGKELSIGPVLGILSGVPPIMLGKQIVSLYQNIAENASKKGMICYFFTPDLINFEKETVTGFKYIQKKWITEEFPMPDIIYNQTGYLSEEVRPSYSRLFLDYLKNNESIKLINPFLALRDKMQNHDLLSSQTAIRKYLPHTQNCASFKSFYNFLGEHNSVYLKPITSSLGMGVYKVSVNGNQEYTVEYHPSKSEKINEKIKNRKELSEVFERITKGQPYLVQEAVKLIVYQNRPVDFRIHLFKNTQGEWNILVANARVGPVSGIITGRIWGGCRFQADEILSDVFSPVQGEKIINEIEEAVIQIAQAIDHLHEKPFGELGFDIAVDENKEIWMIEVNPKPNWSLPAKIDENPLEEKVAEHLLGYCRCLLNLGEPVIIYPEKYNKKAAL